MVHAAMEKSGHQCHTIVVDREQPDTAAPPAALRYSDWERELEQFESAELLTPVPVRSSDPLYYLHTSVSFHAAAFTLTPKKFARFFTGVVAFSHRARLGNQKRWCARTEDTQWRCTIRWTPFMAFAVPVT